MQPKIVLVAAGVYALLGSGGEITPENGGRTANVAFIVGRRGIVVVDTGTSYREGEDIIAAVKASRIDLSALRSSRIPVRKPYSVLPHSRHAAYPF